MLQVPSVSAQNSVENYPSCPIIGEISADFTSDNDAYQVEDTFYETVLITNYDSNYTIAGVQVALAIYESDIDVVPLYWTVLPETYQIYPDMTLQAPVAIDLSSVSFGEYVIKVFAVQGDYSDVLGGVLHDIENTEGKTLIKSTAKSSGISVALSVNGQSEKGQAISLSAREPIELSIVTSNEGTLPLTNSYMVGVITQGAVPLGTALRVDKFDSVGLIPSRSKVTVVNDRFVEGGLYTAYAALVTENAFQSLVSNSINVGVDGGGYFGSHISVVGLSDYPLQPDSEVIVCVNNLGANHQAGLFMELLGVEFKLDSGDGEVVNSKVFSDKAMTKNYFTFSPGVQLSKFNLSVDFLQQRFNTEITASKEYNVPDQLTDSLFVVDTLKLEFVCRDSELCNSLVRLDETNNPPDTNTNTNTLLYYIIIIIVLVLASVIMFLRRRKPGSDYKEPVTETPPKELL